MNLFTPKLPCQSDLPMSLSPCFSKELSLITSSQKKPTRVWCRVWLAQPIIMSCWNKPVASRKGRRWQGPSKQNPGGRPAQEGEERVRHTHPSEQVQVSDLLGPRPTIYWPQDGRRAAASCAPHCCSGLPLSIGGLQQNRISSR